MNKNLDTATITASTISTSTLLTIAATGCFCIGIGVGIGFVLGSHYTSSSSTSSSILQQLFIRRKSSKEQTQLLTKDLAGRSSTTQQTSTSTNSTSATMNNTNSINYQSLNTSTIISNNNNKKYSIAMQYAEDCRRLLPQTIILIRHGESDANADQTVWKKAPDNLIGLTEKGRQQALAVGKRVRDVLLTTNKTTSTAIWNNGNNNNKHTKSESKTKSTNDVDGNAIHPNTMDTNNSNHNNNGHKRVHLIVSPFERTKQTATIARSQFESMIVRTDIESRIREQEVGNIQNEQFHLYRQEQERIGRFFYRFPTGESGADVFDRVKSWWYESVLTVNLRIGYEPIDSLVVVTHGLAMRFMLMQLFNWSPTTFHSVYNASNCEMYVLQKDMSKPGSSPYVLDTQLGDMPKSSINVRITFKKQEILPHIDNDDNDDDPIVSNTQRTMIVRLDHYLNIPPPRTTRTELIKHMLVAQHPNLFVNAGGVDAIDTFEFMPFVKCDDPTIMERLLHSRKSSTQMGQQQQQAQQQQQHLLTPTTSSSWTSVIEEEQWNNNGSNDDNCLITNESINVDEESSTTLRHHEQKYRHPQHHHPQQQQECVEGGFPKPTTRQISSLSNVATKSNTRTHTIEEEHITIAHIQQQQQTTQFFCRADSSYREKSTRFPYIEIADLLALQQQEGDDWDDEEDMLDKTSICNKDMNHKCGATDNTINNNNNNKERRYCTKGTTIPLFYLSKYDTPNSTNSTDK